MSAVAAFLAGGGQSLAVMLLARLLRLNPYAAVLIAGMVTVVAVLA